jgi:[ribulose-bisphosphate carboxylase]-lysine N-methyltransferase
MRAALGLARAADAAPPPRAARRRRRVAAAAAAAPAEGLARWAAERGVDLAKSAVALSPDGGALLAARAAAAGEALLVVPEGTWLTPTAAARAAPLGALLDGLEPWVAVALLLIHARADAASPWAAYAAALPPGGSESPVAWPAEDLAALAGTQAAASAEAYRAFFAERHAALAAGLFAEHPGAFDPAVFSAEAFQWAALAVRARAHAPLDGADLALVPLADLVAHARGGGANARWAPRGGGVFGGGRALALEAARALAPGELVAMDFGPGRTEGQVLLDHGAADVGAPGAGGFALTVTLPAEDRFYDDKIDILEQAGLRASNEHVLRAGDRPPDALLANLRLLGLSGGDAFLLEALFRDEVWGHLAAPVSAENEAALAESMVAGCAAALAALPGGGAADAAAARGGGRAALAAAVRLGERRALEGAANWFGARLEALDALEYYQDRRLKRLGLLDAAGRPTDWEGMFEDGIA